MRQIVVAAAAAAAAAARSDDDLLVIQDEKPSLGELHKFLTVYNFTLVGSRV